MIHADLKSRAVLLLLFFTCFLSYLWLGKGYVDTSDAQPSMFTAKSLYSKGQLAIPGHSYSFAKQADGSYRAKDGRPLPEKGEVINWRGYVLNYRGEVYSWFDLGHPVLLLPAVIINHNFFWLASKVGFRSSDFLNFLIGATNSVLSALVCVVMYCFALRVGLRRSSALLAAIGLGFGSFHIYYATASYRENFIELMLLSAAYFLFRYRSDGRIWSVALAGVSFSLAAMTKQSFAPVGAILFLFLACFSWKRRDILAPLVFGGIGALCLAVLFYFNYSRFGSVLEVGYGKYTKEFGFDGFGRQFYHFFLSPEKSLFLHNPILFLLFPAVIIGWQRARALTLLSLAIAAYLSMVHLSYLSRVHYAWGPRYFLVCMPFFLLLIGFCFETERAYLRRLLICILLGSIFFSVVPTLSNPREYEDIRRAMAKIAREKEIENAHIPSQIEGIYYLLKEKVKKSEPVYEAKALGFQESGIIDLSNNAFYYGLSVWPSYLTRRGVTGSIWLLHEILLVMCALLMVACLQVYFRFRVEERKEVAQVAP